MPRDPVCGMQVHALWATAEVEYDGQRFFFCSLACRDAFVQHPERYVEPSSADADEGPPAPSGSTPHEGKCCWM